MFVEVAFNIPVNSTFFYSIPDSIKTSDVKTGLRISAKFGSRLLTGLIVNILTEKPEVEFEIKNIEKIIDSEPLFDSSYKEIAQWVSNMYLCSVGEALFAMIPSGRREKDFILDIQEDDYENNREKITLNSDQKAAIEKIRNSEKTLFYLYGITGSGKTEVYLELAQEAVNNGKSVIYLVPEIALTHQLTEYLTGKFGSNIAVLHSGLTPSQKLSQWRKIQSGEYKIVLGARSAIFAPVKDPALIIIDEEHETTYKSGSSPRYHARQVAMHRIKLSGGKLIMGSATPSVEAYNLMVSGDIEKIILDKIAAGGSFVPVKIVEMSQEASTISTYLAKQIREVTAAGGQVILFLNRRGFFYYFHCHYCGYEFKCKQCSVSLTYHKDRGRLICHYCGYSEKPPEVCPECGSREVGYSGFGTEKIENDIKTLFPYLSVERVDKDNITKGKNLKSIFEKFKNREINILLGTQIITKGLNFPGVKLVGIILADTTLQLPDFRSAERTYSLITQVAGRTGRFNSEGEVVIQTYRPDNYSIKCAAGRKSEEFYEKELDNRKSMDFPPFSRIIRVIFRSKEAEKAKLCADNFYSALAKLNLKNVKLLGPAECPISLIAGNSRYHILVISSQLRYAHFAVREALKISGASSGVYIEIDVDPVSLM